MKCSWCAVTAAVALASSLGSSGVAGAKDDRDVVRRTRRPPDLTVPLPPPIEVDKTGCVIPGDFFFRHAEALVLPGAEQALVGCIEAVRTHVAAGGRVFLIASTDGTGDHELVNMPLSTARGQAIRTIMTSNGVNPAAIEIVAIGEEGAVDGVSDPERRRVVVELR